MCGIAGLMSYDPARGNALVEAMLRTMVHRGPDADGLWVDAAGRCILGHRRLSIIDTSDAGRQPMSSSDGRWVISFNGEIYNYRELASVVSAAGMPPRGKSDTEVLANAIALWGTDALPKLDGMYAFAAFDTLSGRLILARDAFGEKPLYYFHPRDGELAFASELQALEQLPAFDGAVSVDAVAELLMFQYIGAPRTIYERVHKLAPGHWMMLTPGGRPATGRHFRFAPGEAGFTNRSNDDLADELEDLLARSIERRLISDVPLGAFLSGGVDSSTVCALIRRKLGRPLQTFSIGFAGAAESEHETARAFAGHLGTEHHDEIVAPSASKFLHRIGQLLDEPNADSSCLPTYLLSEFARRRVTVAVSGDGGDELFGGYGRYFATLDEETANRGSSWRPGPAYYADRILVFTEPMVRDLLGEVPQGAAARLAQLREELDAGATPLFCGMRRSDVENYLPGAVLPKVDRMSMRHSLEVRTPFLNVELARFAERLPQSMIYAGKGKPLLRHLAYRYLPRGLIDAPKQGFALPMSRWGKRELLSAAKDLLSSDDSRLRAALGSKAIDSFLSRQAARGGFATYQVWAVAMLESWLRHHPARLDHLREAAASAWSRRRPTTLQAFELRSSVFVAFERASSSGLTASEKSQLTQLLSRIYVSQPTPLETGPVNGDGVGERLDLPAFGERLSKVHLESLSTIRGASLLLPGVDIAGRLNYFELAKLRRLGIRAVTFLNPHAFGYPVVQLQLQTQSRLRRVWNGLRLMLRSTARIGWSVRVRSYLRKRSQRSQDKMYVSDALPGVASFGELEVSNRFMLYEGLRQLPPIPVSHAEIAAGGQGRYSVWEQRCFYSPTSISKLLTRPYSLVERTSAKEPLMEFVPAEFTRHPMDIRRFCDLLSQLVATRADEETPPIALAPNDRVALVTYSLAPGGAERQWCYLAQELKALGYQVSVVAISPLVGDASHYVPLLETAGIELTELGSVQARHLVEGLPKGPLIDELLAVDNSPFGTVIALLAATLSYLRPKAVFAQLDIVNVLAGTAALAAGVPQTVLSLRNYSPARFPYLNQPWFLPLYTELARSNRISLAGNSRAGNDDYADWLGIPQSAISWIPNAVVAESASGTTTEQQQDVLRRELRLDAAAPVILGVFRLSDEKRPQFFVDVCAKVMETHPEARALIAGVGPLQATLREYIRSRGLESRISLLGRRHDIDCLMRLSSMLLLTSCFEGMPNAVMEAQLTGLPVVASNVGGVPDCISEGCGGYLIDPDDFDGFVSRCLTIIQSQPGHAARHQPRVELLSRFSKKAMAERFITLVNNASAEHGKASGARLQAPARAGGG
jgi:asparagine synthase (glutamine-hydrolysing)